MGCVGGKVAEQLLAVAGSVFFQLLHRCVVCTNEGIIFFHLVWGETELTDHEITWLFGSFAEGHMWPEPDNGNKGNIAQDQQDDRPFPEP